MRTLTTRELYNVLDDLTVEVEVENNPYQFQLDQLFQMATRINKKRSFLFVSKVLGKHLAVDPHIPLLVGNLLAMRYMEVVYGKQDPRATKVAKAIQTQKNLKEVYHDLQANPIELLKPTTFIGFAETATALGHAVFSSFAANATYIHTTREQVNELPSIIHFEEEHSHATSHRVYARDQQLLNNDEEVVLVDDEMTTGKTAVNIIRTIKATYPAKKVFTVVSILDWRTAEHQERYRQLESELAITIHAVTLVKGTMSVTGQPTLKQERMEMLPEVTQDVSFISLADYMKPELFEQVTSINSNGQPNHAAYLKATGRFGLTTDEDETFSRQLQTMAVHLKERRTGTKTLVIGTGEFMYVPMYLATKMGPEVYFQATTRSPIYQTTRESYTIQSKFTFDSPENAGIMNHLYNIAPNQYDEIFIFIERMSSVDGVNALLKELAMTQIPKIQIVVMTERMD